MSCRTQLSKSGDCSGGTKRVQATRVDPKDVIDSMLESAVHEIERADIAGNTEGN